MEMRLLEVYDSVTIKLLQLLRSLTQDQLNEQVFEHHWTAGQIGDHLDKSYNVSSILKGRVAHTHRPPDQKLGEIQELFLNFDIKMESPEAVLPTHKPIDKGKLLNRLEQKIQWVNDHGKTMDLSKTCLDFEIPEYGPFTRLEWIGFNTLHTQRHIHQLEQIIKHIRNDT